MADEVISLDPAEIAQSRTELNINSGSIRVASDGIDWGDAAIEAYMAEQYRGESPVDFRVPNRTITIPLIIQSTAGTTFAQALDKVQSKVSRIQQEQGWLKRVPSYGGTFFLDVVNASLHLSGGWLQAHGSIDNEAVLTLEAIPDFYGATTLESNHTETSATEITWTETGIPGTYPARVSLAVTEGQAVNQCGLIWSFRCANYDSSATARPAYEAEALQPLDIAGTTVLSGASAGTVVTHGTIASDWTPVVGLNLGGTAYLTHKGNYRLWARVYSTSGTAVQIRGAWDVGDLTNPTTNDPWIFPAGSAFYMADLGELRLEAPAFSGVPLSGYRWGGQIQAKGVAGGEAVSIDRVYLVNTDEGYGTMAAPLGSASGFTSFVARDEFNQTGGNLTGGKTTNGISGISAANPGVITVTSHGLSNGALVWIEGATGTAGAAVNGYRTVANVTANTFTVGVNTTGLSYTSGGIVALVGKALPVTSMGGWYSAGIDTDDYTMDATNHWVQRTAVSDTNNLSGRYAIAPAAGAQAASTVQLDVKFSTTFAGGTGYFGILARYVDQSNYLMWAMSPGQAVAGATIYLIKVKAGTATILAQPYSLYFQVSNFWHRIKLNVDALGNWQAYWGTQVGGVTVLIASGQDADLATGGTLASGREGIVDAMPSATACTRAYDNFLATGLQPDAVLFASRVASLTTDGMFRQDSGGTAYGPVSQVVGDLPRLPPAGLEGRTTEVFVKASRGDLDTMPDSGIDDISARITIRPCWLSIPGS